jgi:hypothetical protein
MKNEKLAEENKSYEEKLKKVIKKETGKYRRII